jgi:hypothetical protein
LAVAIASTAVGTHAETVFRCGSAYSRTPCAESRPVDVTDGRSEAQRLDSLRVTAAEKRLGAQMERDRLSQAALVHTGAGNLGGAVNPPTTRAAPKKLKNRKKPKKTAAPA